MAKEAKTGNTALDAVMSQIRKEFGEMAIMRLGDQEAQDIPVISTGALSLDMALGVGGLPRGRVVECYGQESSGKTTLALHVVANAQKSGGVAAFIDAEHALDPGYAKKIGDESGVWHKARLVNTVNGLTNSVPWKTKGAIDGGGTLVLAAEGVLAPVAVRHLRRRPWMGFLYSTDSGLPLGPFEAKVIASDDIEKKGAKP